MRSQGEVWVLADGGCQFLGDHEGIFWFLFNFTLDSDLKIKKLL